MISQRFNKQQQLNRSILPKNMGCPYTKEPSYLPVLNMTIVGLKQSGKTSLISSIATSRYQTFSTGTEDQYKDPYSKQELGINEIVLMGRVKLLCFEVNGNAFKSWSSYYGDAHIILFVIDSSSLTNATASDKIIHILTEIDTKSKSFCKIIAVFNKIDLLKQQQTMGKQQTKIIQKIQKLKHMVFTCKCSAKEGKGVDKLVNLVMIQPSKKQ